MKTLMKGNEAICAAAIRAGCKAYFGYPITPQNEIPEYMAAHMEQAGGVCVQAESETAAINMVYGAAAAGVRAMTSSSSPGIALKQEGISYLAGADLPCLIVNITRAGPGLGGILPGQADYFQVTRGGGNGDYFTPVYAPYSVQELADLTQHAFNVADRYRTPVMLLGDGILGQMMEPAEIKDVPVVEGDKSWAADGKSDRRPKNIVASIDLSAERLEAMNLRRMERYRQIMENEAMVESDVREGDEAAIVAYGLSARIALDAIAALRTEGIKAGLIRPITLWPFPNQVFLDLPKSVKHILVAELSMGQMIEDVRLAVMNRYPVHFCGRTGGVVFEPSELADKVRAIVREEG
ncbi:MAG: 3-methyl-2-oxobutanoate dehydrogenase subunit VorB [Oscillospiraceae bacterium]|nr:3-methyl-2-oxobutanoate dehydrogenase subunit VorB [Oscillospiraceae bacterium]